MNDLDEITKITNPAERARALMGLVLASYDRIKLLANTNRVVVTDDIVEIDGDRWELPDALTLVASSLMNALQGKVDEATAMLKTDLDAITTSRR